MWASSQGGRVRGRASPEKEPEERGLFEPRRQKSLSVTSAVVSPTRPDARERTRLRLSGEQCQRQRAGLPLENTVDRSRAGPSTGWTQLFSLALCGFGRGSLAG